ncbi:MAG TPA: 3-dehydroquinate synthase [bacterium]|nr:3-dehydroquinate synthase [bacterium]HOL94915.1 3-dehydroquinate synthase [bacterium]HPP01195.1 3-dehydroquinate synthase [bacterium]
MNEPQSFHEIPVPLGERGYQITVGTGLLDQVGERAKALGFQSPVPIITDSQVAPLYGDRIRRSLEQAGYRTGILTFPAGEPAKTLDTVARLYDGMVRLRPERLSGLIALGGGVAGDVAGFVAATYLRGIRFIQVPTTLLAQVDASVGGKVGIDHPGGKNLIGAFHQPSAVLIDPATLQTLDPRQVRAGLAEVIKHGVIADQELFEAVRELLPRLLATDLETYCRIIPWNCRIKAEVVRQDEKESGLRAILNFGHTIGHAVEALTGYERYLHGEAVALGMVVEARLGEALGITPAPVTRALESLLRQAGFSLARPGLSADDLLESLFRDKKVEKGLLRFVFPTAIGRVIIQPVDDPALVRRTWELYGPNP